MFEYWWVYLLVGVIFLYVITQSVVALIKARKQAKLLGITTSEINQTISSSAVFSIAPSIAILISLVVLSRIFGPWIAGMRLATLGAFTYEMPAATNVLNAFGISDLSTITMDVGVTALWVMTLGCIPPLLLVPFFYKRIAARFDQIKEKNAAWKDILMDALFLGMISAFVGLVVAPVEPAEGDPYFSVVALLVFLSSALIVTLLGLLSKRKGFNWLKNYALPLAMVISMALAIVYTGWGLR